VGQYRVSVTPYFFSSVIGNVDIFFKCTIFGTIDTFLAALLDISVTFLKCTLSKKLGNFLKFNIQLLPLTLSYDHYSIIEWYTMYDEL